MAGSSNKKKKDKQKDFRKAKLRVGKAKEKPTNYTDVSFSARTISLPGQSISRRLDAETDLVKRLQLLKHHQSNTRKETLLFIEQHLPENPSIYKQILTASLPLMLDQSQSVRNALVDLLVAAAKKQPSLMELHARSVVLFVHSAMTHISPEIRNDSTKYLGVLIQYAADPLARSAWVKTLTSFFTLLGWTLSDSRQSVSLAVTTSASAVTSSSSGKARARILEALTNFIRAGAVAKKQEEQKIVLTAHPLTLKYMAPDAPQPFAHLKLFVRELPTSQSSKALSSGSSIDSRADLKSISCEDYETRRRVLVEFFAPQILQNVQNLVKEGGELGKSAHSVQKLCDELTKQQQEMEGEI